MFRRNKKMNKQLVGLFAVAALMTGCATPYSEAPISSNFPTTKQLQLRTAAHWTTIAQDVANQLISRLPEKAKVYVKAPAKNTPFERAFSSQLMTSLTNAGYAVMKYPDGALLVEVDTQAVKFSSERPRHQYAGAATTLGAGLWAIHDVVVNTSPGAGAMLGFAAIDAMTWFRSEVSSGAVPRTEIIVNASVSNADQYFARTTSVYYIAEDDHGAHSSLYGSSSDAAARMKTFEVKGAE
jgi:hypothetical protein